MEVKFEVSSNNVFFFLKTLKNVVFYILANPNIYIYISGVETGLVLLVPGATNNSVNVIQNGLKIIH